MRKRKAKKRPQPNPRHLPGSLPQLTLWGHPVQSSSAVVPGTILVSPQTFKALLLIAERLG